MAKQSNALAKSKTPEEKLNDYLEFGQAVMKYYRQIPDPQQLAMDAKVFLKENLTREALTAAFELYLASKSCDFPPRPGQLIALVTRDETPRSEFQVEPMPCSCSKEKLVGLKGQECEHGTRWGLGALREILKPEEIAELPKVDISDRRKVLQEQACRAGRK